MLVFYHSRPVATTGSVTIPLMKRTGFKPEVAGAIESVASNAGHIMPPVMGAVAFVMCEFLEIPYSKLIIWAFIPASLYVFATFIMVDIEAVKSGIKGLPRQQLPSLKKTLSEGWFYLLPIVFLIVIIVVFAISPSKSAVYAMVMVIGVSFLDRRKGNWMKWQNIMSCLETGAKAMLMVGISLALAGIVIGSVAITGLGVKFSSGLLSLCGGSVELLVLMSAVACFVLGMGLSSTPIYITLVVLVAPALVELGIPELVVHLSIMYWGTLSFIIPPVAIAAYAGAALAGAKPMATAVQATRIGFAAYLMPIVMIYNPALVCIGTPMEIGLTLLFTIGGISAIGFGLGGSVFSKVGYVNRGLLIVARIAQVWPDWLIKSIGAAIFAFIVFQDFIRARYKRDQAGNLA